MGAVVSGREASEEEIVAAEALTREGGGTRGLAARINALLEPEIAAPGDGSLLDRALSSTGREPPNASELAYLRVEILLSAWREMHREAARNSQVNESRRVQVMQVLDLILDVAYHDGTDRDLAVAAEAYTLAGYHDGAIMISHARDQANKVAAARRSRPKKLLRHDAQGLLYAVGVLIDQGLVSGRAASRRRNERWQERGGHDFA